LFTLFTQSVKNGPSLLETVKNETVAFKRAMYHARTHGQVFVQHNTGKVERVNAKGDYVIVINPEWK
jgi:ribosomal protein L16 Arg81 hydroxylase